MPRNDPHRTLSSGLGNKIGMAGKIRCAGAIGLGMLLAGTTSATAQFRAPYGGDRYQAPQVYVPPSYDRRPRFFDGPRFFDERRVVVRRPYYQGPGYYDPDEDDAPVIYRRRRPAVDTEVFDDDAPAPTVRQKTPPKPPKAIVTKRPEPKKQQQASGVKPVVPLPPASLPPASPPPAATPPANAANIPATPGVPPAGEQRLVPDEVVFEFKPQATPQAIDDVIARNRLERIASWRFRLTDSILYRYRITDGRSVSTVVAALEQDQSIQAAQPNYIYTLQQPVAEAAGDAKQVEPPQAVPASSAGLPQQYVVDIINLRQARTLADGSDVLVAVIDSAIDTSHPEVAGVVSQSFDAIGGDVRPDLHGTAMTGAIAAHGQLMGVAPKAHVVAVRAFEGTRPAGSPAPKPSAQGTTFHVMRGLDWSYERQARIVNMSFAGPKDPALGRMIAAAHEKKMILIAAAGNAGAASAPLYPAADPNVIAVTASDQRNGLYQGSNRGGYIAVASPGVDVLVAAPNGAYDFTTGTSVATAHVSGLVALMLQRQPDLDTERVRVLLSNSGHLLELVKAPDGADERPALIDAAAAVQAAGSK